MTRTPAVLASLGALAFSACEPTFVDVTFDGAPTCKDTRLTNEVVVKLEGPRSSAMFRLDGRATPMTTKLVAGKLYKVKAYKCAGEPCEAPGNLFHGEEFTAPEKAGNVTLTFPGAPPCVEAAPPPAPAAEDAGGPAAAPAADAG